MCVKKCESGCVCERECVCMWERVWERECVCVYVCIYVVLIRGIQKKPSDRQRILLARALLTKPRVLLIDEIDANLDSESRSIIENTLNNFEGAIIQVSHHTPFNIQKTIRYWQLESQQLYTDIHKPKAFCA